MAYWIEDKAATDPYLDQVIGIIKTYTGEEMRIADLDEDRAGADLIGERWKAGVRLRSSACKKYEGEFTIRAWRPSKRPTEYLKLMRDSSIRFYLYGFRGEDGSLTNWALLDMAIWRDWVKSEPVRRDWKELPDGTGFFIYHLDDFPPEMVVASGTKENFCH